jgi:hypothetical protein
LKAHSFNQHILDILKLAETSRKLINFIKGKGPPYKPIIRNLAADFLSIRYLNTISAKYLPKTVKLETMRVQNAREIRIVIREKGSITP